MTRSAHSNAGLQPFTEYSCQLQAGNSAGYGDWSEAACVRTAASAPSAPVGLQAYGEALSHCFVISDSLTKALPVLLLATSLHQGQFQKMSTGCRSHVHLMSGTAAL